MVDIAERLRVAGPEAEDLPPDVLLGRIILFTVSDQPVSRASLEKEFQELGLDEGFLPPPNKYQHAFEKATSEVRRSYPLPGDRTAHVLCRNVSKARDVVIRQITREVQNNRHRKLSYDEVITVRFFRPKPGDQSKARLLITLNPDHLEPEEERIVRGIARSIKRQYERYYDFLDGQKVRAMVRAYLRHLNCIEIKGGVYFIHANRDPELAQLWKLVNNIAGCSMDLVAVADVESQRRLVTRAFEREAHQALTDLVRDIEAMRSSRKTVTEAAYARMSSRYDEIVDNATEHMLKLRTTQDITAASAEEAASSLAALQEMMHDKKKGPT